MDPYWLSEIVESAIEDEIGLLRRFRDLVNKAERASFRGTFIGLEACGAGGRPVNAFPSLGRPIFVLRLQPNEF